MDEDGSGIEYDWSTMILKVTNPVEFLYDPLKFCVEIDWVPVQETKEPNSSSLFR